MRIKNAPGGNRTPDTRYRKPLLYPLSYRCIQKLLNYISTVSEKCKVRFRILLRNVRFTSLHNYAKITLILNAIFRQNAVA